MTTVRKYHGAEQMRGIEIPRDKNRIGWLDEINIVVPQEKYTGSRFGRMFPNDPRVPPPKGAQQRQPRESIERFASLMGGADGKDDNPRIPAGFTFLGQFLGHDITFDPTSSLEQQRDLEALRNYRTPALDLDSLYGSGLAVSPHLYDREQQGKFLLDEGKEFDLPRNSQGTALIADPRNDGNLILAQLHLAFLKFHNAVLDQIDKPYDGIPGKGDSNNEKRFERAQRLVRWHYQWIILREFLPLIVGRGVVLDILNYLTHNQGKLEYYQWDGPDPFIPVEFSVAAYRFGHSQVRSIYRINDNYDVGVLPLFSPKPRSEERQDLQGGSIKKKHAVNWKNFFETGVPETPGWKRHSKKINTQLASPLLFPPHTVVPNRPGETRSLAMRSLAVRDLERGQDRGLPSGQEVVQIMKEKKRVKVNDLDKGKFNFDELRTSWGDRPKEEQEQLEQFKQQFEQKTPLWYYILKEAEVQHDGKMLGDVGGRIVAEVFIGLLQADETSLIKKVDLAHLCEILRDDPDMRDTSDDPLKISLESFRDKERHWRPVLPGKKEGDFTIVDLLSFAGVDTK